MRREETLLEIRDIYKSFGSTTVLKGVSLEVHKGEVIVLIGPSGCGKSTLLRCINGLEKIKSGEILLDGKVITSNKTNWREVRQKIGMVFQSYDLFPHMTVMGNVLLGPVKAQKKSIKEAEEEAEQLLKRVGLWEKKDAYPRQLSGGQKQRVAIVRALIMQPEIILFDEITAALDPEMVREVLDVMLELAKKGATMVIVTHEMQFARAVADKVVFLDSGEIVEQGDPNEVFLQPKTARLGKFLNTFVFEEIDKRQDSAKEDSGSKKKENLPK